MDDSKQKYTTIKFKKEFASRIDKHVGYRGFRSRTHFVVEAIERLLKSLEEEEAKIAT